MSIEKEQKKKNTFADGIGASEDKDETTREESRKESRGFCFCQGLGKCGTSNFPFISLFSRQIPRRLKLRMPIWNSITEPFASSSHHVFFFFFSPFPSCLASPVRFMLLLSTQLITHLRVIHISVYNHTQSLH